VFDFCLGALFVVGFFMYEPNMKKWLAAQVGIVCKSKFFTVSVTAARNHYLFAVDI
jgi:hypothetical protein